MIYSTPILLEAIQPDLPATEVRNAICRNCNSVIGEQFRNVSIKNSDFVFVPERDKQKNCPHCGHRFHDDKNDYWCIAIEENDKTLFLGWRKPTKNKSGYFWTANKNIVREVFFNSTPEHPFLFKTEQEAINYVSHLNITKKLKVDTL